MPRPAPRPVTHPRCAPAALLALLALLAFGGCGEPSEPRAPPRPHVVLLLVDTLRADRLDDARGLTPHLAALGAEAVVFERAIAPACWTKPSVASLFTGLYPGRHGALGTPRRRPNLAFLEASFTTLAEALAAAGYRTGAFVSNPHILPTYRFDQGFEHFVQPAGAADELLSAAGDWLQAAPDDQRPVLLYLHLIDPHAPYDPPAEARQAWVSAPAPEQAAFTRAGLPLEVSTWLKQARTHQGPGPLVFDPGRLRPELLDPGLIRDVRRQVPEFDPAHLTEHVRFDFSGWDDPDLAARVTYLQQLYDAEVAATDAAIGRFLARLDDLGLGDDTLLLVVADHGEAFLEHQAWGHGNALQPEEVDVPMILRAPPRARRPEAVVDAPVSLVDVLPTLVELLDLPPVADLDGVSLVPWLEGHGDAERVVFSELIAADREELAAFDRHGGLVRRQASGGPARWEPVSIATGTGAAPDARETPTVPEPRDGHGAAAPPGPPEPADAPRATGSPDTASPREQALRDAIEQRRARRDFDPAKPLPLDELSEEQRDALRALGYG